MAGVLWFFVGEARTPIERCPFCGKPLEDGLSEDEVSPLTVVLDVDGVLAVPEGEYEERAPYPFAARHVRRLKEDGYRVVIATARYMGQGAREGKEGWGLQKYAYEQGYGELARWLARHDIPYDALYLGKPSGNLYVDDRAFPVLSGEGEDGWFDLHEFLREKKANR